MKKNTIIKGTLILTIAGLITRIIGFFYKIYLSNALGAEKLGIYQLVFPIYAICFTLYASGIQTAISKMISDEHGRQKSIFTHDKSTNYNLKRILKIGLACSVIGAFICSFVVYFNAGFIAKSIIKEPSCEGSLRVLSLVFPFCSFTSCINGYYYGLKKPGVPATTQLLEQIVRVIVVYVVATYFGNGDGTVTCELAVMGIVVGEIASMFYNCIAYLASKKPFPTSRPNQTPLPVVKPLIIYSLPSTGNHVIVSILHSVEAILIPAMLKRHGLSSSEALSIYGILVGMSMPFILFPSTITNSLAVLLLPTISEANASHNQQVINKTTSTTIKYSVIIGIFSTGAFILFGQALGNSFYHNELSGRFIVCLAWLCPFIYLTTTLGSIINGLGQTHLTFINTVTGLGIRILFIIYMVPTKGIYGYLIGLLVSQLAIALLDYLSLKHSIQVELDVLNWFIKPILIMIAVGYVVKKGYDFIITQTSLPNLLVLCVLCLLLVCIYVPLLFLTKSIALKEFK